MDIDLAIMISGTVLAAIAYFSTRKQWASTLIVGLTFMLTAVLGYANNKDTTIVVLIFISGLVQLVWAYIFYRKKA